MRIDNQPYGRMNELIYDQAFTVHPYKHPTIGSMKDLEAASIGDVRDFFRTYYVPNNATLVLVGDFNTKDAQELVTKYLGRVPKSDRPVPRDIPKEPPQVKERYRSSSNGKSLWKCGFHPTDFSRATLSVPNK